MIVSHTRTIFLESRSRYETDSDRKETLDEIKSLAAKPIFKREKIKYEVTIGKTKICSGITFAYSPNQALTFFVKEYLQKKGVITIWLDGQTKIYYFSSWKVLVSDLLRNGSMYKVEMKV
jgi:hypothetical protein